jgi:hypothetical protein
MYSSSQSQRQKSLYVNGRSQKSLPGTHDRLPLSDSSNRRLPSLYENIGMHQAQMNCRPDPDDFTNTPNRQKRKAPPADHSDDENTPPTNQRQVTG